MREIKEYTYGEIVGKCIFVKELPSKIYSATAYNKYKTVVRIAIFKCDCGQEFVSTIRDVKGERTTSCGCSKRKFSQKRVDEHTKHGQYYHPLYPIWNGMRSRCFNSRSKAYKDYGGRGITVCNEWLDINKFIEDMFPSYIEGLFIDRIDNDGDYCKENCRWVTREINNSHKRNTIIVKHNGVEKTAKEWAECLDIPYKTFISRLHNWGNVEKSFTYQNNRWVG